ncbi:peptidylprolyl isomerase [Meiothermus sp.]|uniref:peptidylprolyl isomerase n=2 Tax=Meiothermus sp. TaxID=1955249 RepID=UPI0039A2E269
MRVALMVAILLALAAAAYVLWQGGSPEPGFGGNMEALPYKSDKPVTKFAKPEQVIDAARFDYFAEIETSKGKIGIDLYETEAPNTVNSFVFLALHRYFEGIVFHRVIPGFVAQTGDPTGTGMGGPGYQFGLEVTPRLNYDRKGVLGMARTMDPNSNGSQFFITYGPTPNLNQQYTIFGQVTQGMEVVEKINPTEGPMAKPERDKILSVKIFARSK